MAHTDVLDRPEPLRNSFFASIAFHAGLVGAIVATSLAVSSDKEKWGDPKSLGGGAVGITPVAKIPLPARAGIRNPVANDTESVIPSRPKPEPKAAKVPDPKAIALKSKDAVKRAAETSASTQKYRPDAVERPNQVYSSTGQAAVSPLYSLAPGGGGVGSGSQNPFGYGFGWYAQLIRDKVARNWRTEQVDPRLKSAPEVVIVFELYRNGSARNFRVGQSSGNFALDQSSLRAVATSTPFQPFPPNMPKDMYMVDLTFRLSR